MALSTIPLLGSQSAITLISSDLIMTSGLAVHRRITIYAYRNENVSTQHEDLL